MAVVREIPEFKREPRRGAFRSWLRAITVNRLRYFLRSERARAIATGNPALPLMLDQLKILTAGLVNFGTSNMTITSGASFSSESNRGLIGRLGGRSRWWHSRAWLPSKLPPNSRFP